MSASSKAREIKTPRGYISWTQLDLIEKNEDEYIRTYIQGQERKIGKAQERAMTFGKTVAEVLEGADTDDEIIRLVKATIPRHSEMEKEITATLTAHGRSVKMLGRLDSYEEDPDEPAFLEYKTGKVKWTQKMANKHGQLLFYKTMIWINIRKMATSELIWIPTEDVEGEQNEWGEAELHTAFTGDMPVIFAVEHTTQDILEMMQRVNRAALRIEELYQEEVKNVFA